MKPTQNGNSALLKTLLTLMLILGMVVTAAIAMSQIDAKADVNRANTVALEKRVARLEKIAEDVTVIKGDVKVLLDRTQK